MKVSEHLKFSLQVIWITIMIILWSFVEFDSIVVSFAWGKTLPNIFICSQNRKKIAVRKDRSVSK